MICVFLDSTENVEPCQLSFKNCLSTKDELKLKIESMENAAAVLCSLSGNQKQSKCFLEDIIGLVALIGTVQSPDLGRFLISFSTHPFLSDSNRHYL